MIEENTIKINEGVRRTGKDEMNLIELPFTLLTKRNPKQLKKIKREWKGKGEDGKERNFYKIITGSEEYGLPTFIGEEVYLACMELSYKQGFTNRKVSTTQYELIKLMGWGDNGKSYTRLIKALNQLGGIWITTNAFWDNQNKTYRKIGFGLLSNYEFFENERKGRRANYKNQAPLPLGYFRWDDILFNSFQKGNIKTINISLYFSLKSYISKRLYRFTDKKLYNQKSFEIDLFKLAFDKLEMTGEAYKHPSKILQNLRPAIQELKERGIAEIEIKKSKTESGYKSCFSPVTKSQTHIEVEIPTSLKAKKLVNHFHKTLNPEKGHQPTQKETKQAQELLSKYSEEEIKHIISYAMKQAKKTNFEMCYFGAVLNYVGDAISRLGEEKRHKEEEKDLQRKQKKQAKLKGKYEKYEKEKIDTYLNHITPEQKQEEFKRIKKDLYEKYPISRTWGEGTQVLKSTLEATFLEEVKGKTNLLPFQEWLKEEKISL